MENIPISLSCPFSPSMKKKSVKAKFWYKNMLVGKENYLWVSNVTGYMLSDTNVSICTAKSFGGAGGVLSAFFF